MVVLAPSSQKKGLFFDCFEKRAGTQEFLKKGDLVKGGLGHFPSEKYRDKGRF